MKTPSIKPIFVIMLMAALSAQAQINTPEGQIIGGKAKDTAHFVDKPRMHVHEKERVIKEIPLHKSADSAVRATTNAENGTATQQAGDTTAVTQNNTSATTTSTSSTTTTDTTTTPVNNSCANYIYAALGIVLLGAILLYFIFRRKKGQQ